MVKSRQNLIFAMQWGISVKIYDHKGKKNLCGSRVREMRRKRKMSQAELAVRMQVNGVFIERDSISRMGAGTRLVPDYELPVLARILGTTVEYLLGMTDS